MRVGVTISLTAKDAVALDRLVEIVGIQRSALLLAAVRTLWAALERKEITYDPKTRTFVRVQEVDDERGQ